ncbi:ATP-binding cassette sub-family B member 7, mitochondrial [Oopsacas minuta]|uniref:Iron-sulfur clusters transporter ABCB7, mitochondrial n=1 Tax=Oopsacas minuta TaxID=111878 RepID=A0AAV7JLC5_9METZ|nr:ATP-binding cassette sub-family B member 7, mitochondrial [Oopsacas minuta]
MLSIRSLKHISKSRLISPECAPSQNIRPRMFHRGTVHDPTKNPITNESATKILREMVGHLWPHDAPSLKYRVVGALSCLFGAKLLNVQIPFLFKYAIDSLQVLPQLDSVEHTIITGSAAFVIGYGAARLGSTLFSELRNSIFAKVAQTSIRKLARRSFSHLHSLDLEFHLSRDTGGLSRALDRGTRAINFILNAMLFNLLPTSFEVLLVAGLLSYNCGWEYGAISMLTMAVYSIFTFSVTQWRTKFRVEMNKADNSAGRRSLESLLNYETIKYCNAEELEAENYDVSLQEYQKASLKTTTSLSLLGFGQSAIFTLAMAGTMLMAVNAIQAGSMTPGDLVMINGLLFQLSIPLNFLGSVYREIRQSLIDMQNMFVLFDKKPVITEKIGAPSIIVSNTESAIQFDGVSFGYSPEKMVLNNCSFSLPSGKKGAIVGGSGCGKSTVIRMLYRFYDPVRGHILINGQDIQEVSLSSLRSSIGIVPQDTVLFSDSIHYNISYGRGGSTNDEVMTASKLAGLHDSVLSMPQQYDTRVGERGLMLSGGEKQRVVIARTFIKGSPILLFDEATSSLDSLTESHLLESLRATFKSRTSLFIAHRLSTIQDADIIFVMDNGRIVETGSHRDLIEYGQLYRYIWENQTAKNV